MTEVDVTAAENVQDEADYDALVRFAGKCERVFRLPSPHAPGAVFVGAEVRAAAFGLKGYDPAPVSLSGKGLTQEAAFRSCMGEGVEYLSSLAWGDEPAERKTLAEGLSEFAQGDADWFVQLLSAKREDDDTFLRWLPGRRLADNRQVHLPEPLCLRLPLDRAPQPAVRVTSSGCGTAPTIEQAIVTGLLELVERDAAALWWYGGRPAREADPNSVRQIEPFIGRLRGGQGASRRLRFLDLTTDIDIPVVAALSAAPDGSGFACGLAAGVQMKAALNKAALEACQMELAQEIVLLKRKQGGERALNDADRRILRRMAELKECNWPQPVPAQDEAAPQVPDPTTPHEALARCTESLARRGHTVYWVDLTRQSIAVPAARVVIPGLQPLPPNPVTPRLARALDVSNRTATDVVSMIPLL